ncbi:MAG: hypothetical protein WA160_16285 [Pseudobdellovibrio sp.]
MRTNNFKKDSDFFHLNMHFETFSYFKDLDWIRLQKIVQSEAEAYQVEIQVLVMMDTHFHILIESFNKKENFFCFEIQKKLNGLKILDSHCEPIKNLAQYLNAYKYIYNNPVQAGLCEKVEMYRYSSLQLLLGHSVSHCLIADKLRLIQNPYHVLKWLNNDMQFKLSSLKQQNNYY